MSKKKIDPGVLQVLTNELKGASAFFRRDQPKQASQAPEMALEASQPTKPVSKLLKTEKEQETGNKPKRFYTQLVAREKEEKQIVDQSASRPVNQLIDQPVDLQLTSEVVERPVAFYIPKVINERIEEAISYMQKRHGVSSG